MELTIEQALYLAGYGHRKGGNHNTDRREIYRLRDGRAVANVDAIHAGRFAFRMMCRRGVVLPAGVAMA